MSKNEVARALLQVGLWNAMGQDAALMSPTQTDFVIEQRWSEILALASREKLLPMLAAYLTERNAEKAARLQAVSRACAILGRELYSQIEPVVKSLADRELSCMLLKGGDLDLSFYPSTLPRFMWDLDLLVKPPDVPEVKAIFQELGFVQGDFDPETLRVKTASAEDIATIEATDFELVDFIKVVRSADLDGLNSEGSIWFDDCPIAYLQDEAYVAVAYDIHVNLSHGLSVADFWQGCRRVQLPSGFSIWGQSVTDMLWFFAARLYAEALLPDRPVMRLFIDVLRILDQRAEEVDWKRVELLGKKYGLLTNLYYVLWHAQELFGSSHGRAVVPETFLSIAEPRRGGAHPSKAWADFVPSMVGEAGVYPLLTR